MTASCECPEGPVPCDRPITQEDMLCDACRIGWCRVKGPEPPPPTRWVEFVRDTLLGGEKQQCSR